jgi:DME family drug/metabolite transporter
MGKDDRAPTPAEGRWCIVMAAVLWSLGGAFAKVLTQDTFAALNQPPLDAPTVAGYPLPVQMACYRALFAGLVLLPLVRRQEKQVRPLMWLMALCFAGMNATFISALALGTAANAILLQYSAPLWVYLAGIFLLGERAERRSTISLIIGLSGIAIIVAGGWTEGDLAVIALALASGVLYAGVLICLRVLRGVSSRWLTAWNLLLSGLVLAPLLFVLRPPTFAQLVTLFLYGAVQLGLAYWLVARGLRVIGPQEAGTLMLLEPILNPVWAFLVSPETEAPDGWTYLGGGVILAALVYRYLPRAAGEERRV